MERTLLYHYTSLSHLIEIFKNHRILKIFQKEDYEKKRADEFNAVRYQKSGADLILQSWLQAVSG